MNYLPAVNHKKVAAEPSQSTFWNLPEIAGRLVEISGCGAGASLTLAFSLVLEAQQRGELVGWSMSRERFFYPPDVALGGVDLDALVVIRLPDASAVPRAGEKLLRSGAFGLIVLDIGPADIPTPLQARLTGLARQRHTALLCLTKKEHRELSLGSLISLRAHTQRRQTSQGRFACDLKVLKDKRRGPMWSYRETCRGPAGLC